MLDSTPNDAATPSSISSPTSRPSVKAKAKAPPPPAAKAKGAAKQKGLPTWQGPSPGLDWKAERVVNWQPIRNEARWNGSVWEKIHNSMQGKINLPPDKVLEKFMTKPSEGKDSSAKEGDRSDSIRFKAPVAKRLLPREKGLIADIHHALLVRKGFSSPLRLCWVLGPLMNGSIQSEENTPLPEDVLEAVSGLLDAGASAESLLRQESEDSHIARSEHFLRIIFKEYGQINVLQSNVRTVLYMLHFPLRITGLERDLTLALCAASGVMNSAAMPVLLEGFLLLGNSVNSSSKNLGGAVGVTLESLAKLANTKCLSDKKGGKQETALLVLVQYLQEGCPDLIKNLARDLDACSAARDFDQKLNHESVDDLSAQLDAIEQRMLSLEEGAEERYALPAALAGDRVPDFVTEARTKLASLRELQDELEDATDELRRWFAETADCTLSSMLRSLDALRVALPISRPSAPTLLAKPKRAEGARPRKPSDRRKSVPVRVQPQPEQPHSQQGVVAAESLVSQESSPSDDNGTRMPVIPAITEKALDDAEMPQDIAPHDLVAQILSMKKGTVWVSWFFDWAALPQKFSGDTCERSFEVSQRRDDGYQTFAWHCQKPPLKLDLPSGFRYTFMVRAFVHSCLGSQDASEQTLWVSSLSDAVDVDLRLLDNVVRREKAMTYPDDVKSSESAPVKFAKSHRRSRVASNIGAYIGMLHDSSSLGAASPSVDQQPEGFLAGSVSSSTPLEAHVAAQAGSISSKRDSVDDEPLTLLIRTLSNVHAQLGEVKSSQDQEDNRSQSIQDNSINQEKLAECHKVVELESEPEDLKQLALAFDAIERISMQASAKANMHQVAAKDLDMSSASTETTSSGEMQSWQQSISDNDASALRHLARALSTLDTDVSWTSGSDVEGICESHAPCTSSQAESKTISKESGDELPDGNEVLAAIQRHYSGQSALSTARVDDLPDGNEVLATMQRHYSEQSAQSASTGMPAKLFESAVSEQLVDGNEVLAAMGERVRRDRCTRCGGSGKVGLLGGKGLGMMTKPCECVAQAADSSVRNPFGYSTNRSSISGLAQATRSKMQFSSHLTSFAQSTTSKMPFLSAPLWAAPSRVPSYRLSVRLGEDRVEVLEFHEASALPKRIQEFLTRHHLMSRFSEPLQERAEGMVRYEVHADAVDIVDLV